MHDLSARGSPRQQDRARLADLESLVGALPGRFNSPRLGPSYRYVNKTAHGFTIGTVVRPDATTWVKSQADTAANAIVAGIVVSVPHANAFVVAFPGTYVRGLTGLTAGAVHYLDATTAGALTTTAPAIAVPILLADTTTSGVLMAMAAGSDWHGPLIPDESSRTRLNTGAIKIIDTSGWYWLILTAGGGGGGGGDSTSTPVTGWNAGGGGGCSGQRIFIGPIYLIAGQRIDYTHGTAGAAGAADSVGGVGGNSTLELFDTDGSTPIIDAVVAMGGFGGLSASIYNTSETKGIGGGYGGRPGPGSAAAVHFPYPTVVAPGQDGRVAYVAGATPPTIYRGGQGGWLEYTTYASNDAGAGGNGGEPSGAGEAGRAGALDIVSTATFTLSDP